MMEEVKNEFAIYTDGACSRNPGPGGWGAIILGKGKELELSGSEEETTNNRMELTAVIKALEALPEFSKNIDLPVTIYSDSRYVVDAFNFHWIDKWLERRWRNADQNKVANRDLWEQLLALVEQYHPTFTWVKGHSDNEINNRCDDLAVGAATELKKKLGDKF